MMMSMLGAGGIDLLVDDHRPVDDSNSNGYFEYEPVLSTRDSTEWVPLAEGKAVKVIYALLDSLPSSFDYRVIFMLRDIGDVVESQTRMLERNGQSGAATSKQRLVEIFEKERQRSLHWLREQANFDLLAVEYESIIRNPQKKSREIVDFLGGNLDESSMAASVNPSLRTIG